VRNPFVASITAPKPSGRAQEYACSIHAPVLFSKDKKIFGIDAQQAKELAVEFLKSMLDGRHLTDKSGKPIDLARLRAHG
ncbi:MAG: hypothetical protein ACRET2_05350, partial [Steroidobacteraceae bacterium]